MSYRWKGPDHAPHFEPCRQVDSSSQHIERSSCCQELTSPEYLISQHYFNKACDMVKEFIVSIVTYYAPSLFTTIVPTTPLWLWILFNVSSTSWDCKWKLMLYKFINKWLTYHCDTKFNFALFNYLQINKNLVCSIKLCDRIS